MKTNKKNSSFKLKYIAVCCGLTFGQSAIAQENNNSDNNENNEQAVLEVIVVTSQKRVQTIYELPISVSAMSSEEIESRGISNLIDAQYAVSGLTLSDFGPGQQRAQMRGVGTAGGSTGLATVGFYLDEMPINIGAGAGIDMRLIDMERVEILRGPQPTLYGEGSMGGTIRYITASPELDELYGEINGKFQSVADGESANTFNGILNVPLVDDVLGVRLVAAREELPGWIDSTITGKSDVNNAVIETLRAKVLYTPTEDLSFSLLMLHQEQKQDSQNFGDQESRTTSTPFPALNNESYDLVNFVADYSYGDHNLVATVGYLERETETSFDLTEFTAGFASAPPPFGFGLPSGSITSAGLVQNTASKLWTYELRLASDLNGPFNYNLGAYYRKPEATSAASTVTAPLNLTEVLGFDLFGGNSLQESEGWAVYGDATYEVSDALEFGIGVRYFEDERKQTALPGEERVAVYDTVNPRFSILYSLSPTGSIFVNAAKGFRSGGFNTLRPGFDVPNDFGSEELWSYEIGTKQALFDDHVRIEASLYFNDWDDIQAPSPGFPFPVFTNSGKASGPGLDLTLEAILTDKLSLSATYGYTDMEYDVDSADRLKGDPLDLVAENTYSVALDYTEEVFDNGLLTARIDFMHTSGFSISLRGLPGTVDQSSDSDERDVINLRLTLDFDKCQVSAFVNNVTDDDGTLYPVFGSILEPALSMPRTIGVQGKYRF